MELPAVDSLAAIVKLLPPPVPSSTGGIGKGSIYFLSFGVAPGAAAAAVANTARLSLKPAPPTAPRFSSCLLVSMIVSLALLDKPAPCDLDHWSLLLRVGDSRAHDGAEAPRVILEGRG